MVDKIKVHARIDVADVLRGLAVMGIILLHSIEHFNFYSFPDTSQQSEWLNFSDRAIWDGMFFMFGGKAYAVFALLFGFSFFIQDDNQRLRGHDFRLRFCWRLVLLFIFGNINASFFTAEVLVLYSLVGFILPLVCRFNDKWLLIIACVLLIQPIPLYHVIRATLDPSYITPVIPTSQYWGAAREVQMNGTFLETLKVNLYEGQIASLAWAVRFTDSLLPALRHRQHASRLHHKQVHPRTAIADCQLIIQICLHAYARIGCTLRILPH